MSCGSVAVTRCTVKGEVFAALSGTDALAERVRAAVVQWLDRETRMAFDVAVRADAVVFYASGTPRSVGIRPDGSVTIVEGTYNQPLDQAGLRAFLAQLADSTARRRTLDAVRSLGYVESDADEIDTDDYRTPVAVRAITISF